ncbi:DNA polymerase III subunit [Metamycoplasma alkalescens 14918]|uniref:DNA polymerase III subunit n=1 Tax=Metamycoplasma alkalescens 14918 TaxID=1188234 RepID=N9SQA1_9BACT|nr:DNA polymerase III subunit [Metamycoplasma alkalescens]ENY53655.1 DNA polymerase III subunit [Metamycoplasma alkalescens 14918]
MLNEVFIKIINNSLNAKKLSHAYLLSSKKIKNFDEYFLYFINQINHENYQNFSDIKFGDLYFYIDGKNQNIHKQTILDAMNDTSETSILNQNKKRILIINNIENATMQSLNSLLKYLESPPKNTIIIMSCNFIAKVLKTIKSRAFIIEISTNDNELENSNEAFKNFFANTNSVYDEDLVLIFKKLSETIYQSSKKPIDFLEAVIDFFVYENKEIILDFLIMAFIDVYKIKKEIRNLDLLDANKIKKESFDYIPIYKIISLLKETKINLESSANFNLQKSNLLLKLEQFYDI